MNKKKSLGRFLTELLWAVIMGAGLSLLKSVELGIAVAVLYLAYFWLISPVLRRREIRNTAKAYAIIISRMPCASEEQRNKAVETYLRRQKQKQALVVFFIGLFLFLPLPMILTSATALAESTWGETLVRWLNAAGMALLALSVFGFAGTRHNPLTPAEQIPEPPKKQF